MKTFRTYLLRIKLAQDHFHEILIRNYDGGVSGAFCGALVHFSRAILQVNGWENKEAVCYIFLQNTAQKVNYTGTVTAAKLGDIHVFCTCSTSRTCRKFLLWMLRWGSHVVAKTGLELTAILLQCAPWGRASKSTFSKVLCNSRLSK